MEKRDIDSTFLCHYLPVNSDLKTGVFLFTSSMRPLPKGSYNGAVVTAIDKRREGEDNLEERPLILFGRTLGLMYASKEVHRDKETPMNIIEEWETHIL